MIGCGSMGGNMALLFAEHGITVSLNDPSEETMDQVLATAKKDGLQDQLQKHSSYKSLCKSLGSPKVFVFSLPHGTVGDSVVDGLHTYLSKGDIIIDASNENWQNTQRRQGKLVLQYVPCDGFCPSYRLIPNAVNQLCHCPQENHNLIHPW